MFKSGGRDLKDRVPKKGGAKKVEGKSIVAINRKERGLKILHARRGPLQGQKKGLLNKERKRGNH